MITKELLAPRSITVVGASNDTTKPGGRALENIRTGTFDGTILPVNPKLLEVQGIACYPNVQALPQVDLAILAIAAPYCVETVETLVKEKGCRAIIVLSAGFSEIGAQGKAMEQRMAELASQANATLIGPNCIGLMNALHQSVFTRPIPRMTSEGCDFITGSGATAVFILESALSRGLSFSSVYSVGNAAQIGVEDLLAHIDETYDPSIAAPRTILLYMESITKPRRFLQYAHSLVSKGCKIAAIKAGSSCAGSRAAASHTGAMLNSDTAVEALFRKAGVVRCLSREELTNVGCVMQHPPLRGKNIAIITHAGGPAVMLTDALEAAGMNVPSLPREKTSALLADLFDGSSVTNPIDILATGTAKQVGQAIDTCEYELDEVDGIVVIFGSPGLFPVGEAYKAIRKRQRTHSKPIYAVLPSVLNAHEEMQEFVHDGGVFFDDEVALARALSRVYHTHRVEGLEEKSTSNISEVRSLLANKRGLLPTSEALALLDLAGISRPNEALVDSEEAAMAAVENLGYPLVLKVVGPAHKSELGGVRLNITNREEARVHFHSLMQIAGAEGVQISSMESGVEVFIGVKKEGAFGHLITCGLGGIFVEVMKDIRCALAPINRVEALEMVRSLKSYPIIQGIRGKKGIDEEVIAEALCRVSDLLEAAPEITEMDINPLIGEGRRLVAVDVVVSI